MFFIQQKLLLLQILWGQVSWQCSTLKVKFKRSPSHENQNCHNWHPLIKLLFMKATLNQISCTHPIDASSEPFSCGSCIALFVDDYYVRTDLLPSADFLSYQGNIMCQLYCIVCWVLCSVHPKEDKYFRISKHCSTTFQDLPALNQLLHFEGWGWGREGGSPISWREPFKYGTCLFSSANILIFGCRWFWWKTPEQSGFEGKKLLIVIMLLLLLLL